MIGWCWSVGEGEEGCDCCAAGGGCCCAVAVGNGSSIGGCECLGCLVVEGLSAERDCEGNITV